MLATIYSDSSSRVYDAAEAVKWYRLAAAQGDVTSQVELGNMYSQGKSVLQDYAEALKWYRAAAAQGNASAQVFLGYMYGLGRGTPRDLIRAHMWANLAAATGSKLGVELRDDLAKAMSPQQVVSAQKMSRDCQARKFKNCD